jgi:hypothetical protein
MIYLITFTCYGCHLHGDELGSVDRSHNLPGSRMLEPNLRRTAADKRWMAQPPYLLDATGRAAVLEALLEVCSCRCWSLLAAHVRSTHVHAVVEADTLPERVMNDFKSYASRWLNRMALDKPGRQRWARHGSTRWLWEVASVSGAIHYVVEEQGAPMAVFLDNRSFTVTAR